MCIRDRNKHSLILLSSLSIYSLAPRTKIIFQFLWGILTGYGHPSPFWKIAKMALFYPLMKFENFLGQMTSFFVSGSVHVLIQKLTRVSLPIRFTKLLAKMRICCYCSTTTFFVKNVRKCHTEAQTEWVNVFWTLVVKTKMKSTNHYKKSSNFW